MELQEFLKYQRVKENIYQGIKSNDIIYLKPSISSGINWLNPPNIYNELILNEVKQNHFIKNYAPNDGYYVLLDAIKLYENYKYNKAIQMCQLGNIGVSITSGATAAISILFNYIYTTNNNANFLILGLSYYMFYFCLDRLNFNYSTIVSEEKGRIYPTINEIEDYLSEKNIDYVILTTPQNPSGEVYNEIEFDCLVKLLKINRIKLIIDICQMDEFNSNGKYVNINAIAKNNHYDLEMIIINSFSKTRSIPGARIGYIVAPKAIIEYVSSQNEYYYSNHALLYITPIIIDLLFRIYKLSLIFSNEISLLKLSNIFRKNIMYKLGLDLYQSLFKFIFTDIYSKYKSFSLELENNYQIFKYNKNYILLKLENYIFDYTELQGGFNFCIKFKGLSKGNQVFISEMISKNISSIILPEYAFNGYYIEESSSPFWIRITVAIDVETFKNIVDRLKLFLEQSSNKQIEEMNALRKENGT